MRMLFLFAVSLAAQFAASITAQAGDVAELEILGFTKDGGVFRLEEYGVQDGSVLIAVRQYGFEGPDYRWIAVTGRL
jgi:predicted secreted protein